MGAERAEVDAVEGDLHRLRDDCAQTGRFVGQNSWSRASMAEYSPHPSPAAEFLPQTLLSRKNIEKTQCMPRHGLLPGCDKKTATVNATARKKAVGAVVSEPFLGI